MTITPDITARLEALDFRFDDPHALLYEASMNRWLAKGDHRPRLDAHPGDMWTVDFFVLHADPVSELRVAGQSALVAFLHACEAVKAAAITPPTSETTE